MDIVASLALLIWRKQMFSVYRRRELIQKKVMSVTILTRMARLMKILIHFRSKEICLLPIFVFRSSRWWTAWTA